MICPSCKNPNLMENSTKEEFLCQRCKATIGLYDKSKDRLISIQA